MRRLTKSPAVLSVFIAALLLAYICGGSLNVMAADNIDFTGSVKTVTVGDINIAYKDFGRPSPDSAPLIMIMGYSAGMDVWSGEMLRKLSENRRVIIFDNRGIGYSTASEKEFTFELFAKDTAGLLDALEIEKADVLGYSMGSMIAQEFVLRYPDKINRVILYASNCGGKEAIPMSPGVLKILTDTSGTPEERGKRMLGLLFPSGWMKAHPDITQYFPTITEIASPEIVERQTRAMAEWEGSYERLSGIIRPVLLISGAEDVIMPPQNMFVMGSKIPGAWVVQTPAAGHGAMYQAPQFFAEIINLFLRTYPKNNFQGTVRDTF